MNFPIDRIRLMMYFIVETRKHAKYDHDWYYTRFQPNLHHHNSVQKTYNHFTGEYNTSAQLTSYGLNMLTEFDVGEFESKVIMLPRSFGVNGTVDRIIHQTGLISIGLRQNKINEEFNWYYPAQSMLCKCLDTFKVDTERTKTWKLNNNDDPTVMKQIIDRHCKFRSQVKQFIKDTPIYELFHEQQTIIRMRGSHISIGIKFDFDITGEKVYSLDPDFTPSPLYLKSEKE